MMMHSLKSIHVDGHEASVKGQCHQRVAAARPQSREGGNVNHSRANIQCDKVWVLAHVHGCRPDCGNGYIEVVGHRVMLYKSFRMVLISLSGKDFVEALAVTCSDNDQDCMMRICKAFHVRCCCCPGVRPADDAIYDEREKHHLVRPIAPAKAKRDASRLHGIFYDAGEPLHDVLGAGGVACCKDTVDNVHDGRVVCARRINRVRHL